MAEEQNNDNFYSDLANAGASYYSSYQSRKAAEDYAKELCKDCPLLVACGEYALAANELDGIWAGMTPSERRIYLQKNQRSARSGSLSS